MMSDGWSCRIQYSSILREKRVSSINMLDDLGWLEAVVM